MREKLIRRMKGVFGDDQKRIDHALAVLKYAEQIHAAEGGDSNVIIAAAILHDIGIHEAERNYGSAAGKYQELEGPPIARNILKDEGLTSETIEHICKIIANHHSAMDIDTLEFRVIWDADWLVNIPDECGKMSKDKLKGFIEKIFKTNKGRQLAKELYLNGD
ncbi:MAG: HD domain-containing protein [Planctomycetota bacterium]